MERRYDRSGPLAGLGSLLAWRVRPGCRRPGSGSGLGDPTISGHCTHLGPGAIFLSLVLLGAIRLFIAIQLSTPHAASYLPFLSSLLS